MDISVRLEEEKDYRRVEEITRAAFSYPDRIRRGQFGFKEAAVYDITDSEGYNYPAFMAMELKEGYLKSIRRGKYFESDIYNDELNRETVRAFDRNFIIDS